MMVSYGSIRHPLYSIGEGTFREKEERLRKQGLLKKKKRKVVEPLPQSGQVLSRDRIWIPQQMPTVNIVRVAPTSQSIMDKIWGNDNQKKKKVVGSR